MIFSDLAFIDFFLFGKDGLGSEESANCLPASYDVSWKKILWKWNNYSIISFLLWKQWKKEKKFAILSTYVKNVWSVAFLSFLPLFSFDVLEIQMFDLLWYYLSNCIEGSGKWDI